MGLLRAVIAQGCPRALTLALGDHKSQVGCRNELCRDAPGNPTKYLPAALHT